MSIEIKQLHIKSNVVQRSHKGDDQALSQEQAAQLKEQVLAECKQLVVDVLREQRER